MINGVGESPNLNRVWRRDKVTKYSTRHETRLTDSTPTRPFAILINSQLISLYLVKENGKNVVKAIPLIFKTKVILEPIKNQHLLEIVSFGKFQ